MGTGQTSEAGKPDSILGRLESLAHNPHLSFTDIFKHHDRKQVVALGLLMGGAAAVVVTRGKFSELIGAVKECSTVTEEIGPALRKGAAEAEEMGAALKNSELIGRLRGVQHFVFDLDRTLVDTEAAVPALRDAMHNHLVKETGLSSDFIRAAMEHTEDKLVSPYYWNRLDLIEPLQEMYPGVDLNHRFASVAQASQAAFYDALKPKPETIELLNTVRSQGKSIHVFTAGSPARALEKLHGAGLTGYVDHLFAVGKNAFEDSAASGLLRPNTAATKVVELPENCKTNGKGYTWIIRKLNVEPHDLMMTGDHPIEDIAHAKKRGLLTAQAKWYKALPAAKILPDLELTSPSQLTALLQAESWH